MSSYRLLAAVLIVVSGTVSASAQKTPVLVELFTSEGCSSCPAADALLEKLDREQPAGVEIVALGEHVDYWDELGWHDRFSSSRFTDRQTLYSQQFHLGGVFTPQMVVDGTAQFVGNNAAKAVSAIEHAGHTPKQTLTIAAPVIDGQKISSSVTGNAPVKGKGTLWAALVEPHATTQVRSGENGGRTLNHVAVVRSLTRIGKFGAGPVPFTVTAPNGTIAANLRIVVFAQDEWLGPVLAIGSIGAR